MIYVSFWSRIFAKNLFHSHFLFPQTYKHAAAELNWLMFMYSHWYSLIGRTSGRCQSCSFRLQRAVIKGEKRIVWRYMLGDATVTRCDATEGGFSSRLDERTYCELFSPSRIGISTTSSQALMRDWCSQRLALWDESARATDEEQRSVILREDERGQTPDRWLRRRSRWAWKTKWERQSEREKDRGERRENRNYAFSSVLSSTILVVRG